MYCADCGAKLVEGAKFCGICGKKIGSNGLDDVVPGNPVIEEKIIEVKDEKLKSIRGDTEVLALVLVTVVFAIIFIVSISSLVA